jgi:hypothetical protein
MGNGRPFAGKAIGRLAGKREVPLTGKLIAFQKKTKSLWQERGNPPFPFSLPLPAPQGRRGPLPEAARSLFCPMRLLGKPSVGPFPVSPLPPPWRAAGASGRWPGKRWA